MIAGVEPVAMNACQALQTSPFEARTKSWSVPATATKLVLANCARVTSISVLAGFTTLFTVKWPLVLESQNAYCVTPLASGSVALITFLMAMVWPGTVVRFGAVTIGAIGPAI